MQNNSSPSPDDRRRAISKIQREIFGRQYEGASLATFLVDEFQEGTDKLILDWVEKGRGMMVFLGSPGIGKTQFCASLIDWIYGRVPHFRYHNEAKLFIKIRNAFKSDQASAEYAEALTDDHFFMYDDLGSSSSTEWSSEIIFHIIDCRYNSGRPTVITSNLTRNEIAGKYGQRTYDRMFDSKNLVLEFHDIKSRRTGNTYEAVTAKEDGARKSGMSS